MSQFHDKTTQLHYAKVLKGRKLRNAWWRTSVRHLAYPQTLALSLEGCTTSTEKTAPL